MGYRPWSLCLTASRQISPPSDRATNDTPSRFSYTTRKPFRTGGPAVGHLGYFVLRTPLLPMRGVSQQGPYWIDEPSPRGDDRRLATFMAMPVVREAIALASDSLGERHATSERNSPHSTATDEALWRYLWRMAARPTPYGLFAGVSLGRIGASEQLALCPRSSWRRVSRLDCGVLTAIIQHLTQDPALRAELQWHANTSLYALADRWRYIGRRDTPGGIKYEQRAIERTDMVDYLVSLARDRAQSLATLCSAIVAAEPSINIGEAKDFVSALIDQQILESNLIPSMSAVDPLASLIQSLERVPAATRWLPQIVALNEAVRSVDASVDADHSEARHRIRDSVAALLPQSRFKAMVQVDLIKPTDSLQLSESLSRRVAHSAALLSRVAHFEEPDLAAFCKRFVERYEARMVALNEVIDDDVGIGFGRSRSPPSPLLDTIPIAGKADHTIQWTPWEQRLQRKLHHALSVGEHQVELSDDDLEGLLSSTNDQSVQHGWALFRLAREHDQGPTLPVLERCGNFDARAWIARFAHADPALAEVLAGYSPAVADSDTAPLHAEVMHLPAGRSGNVILRTHSLSCEIVFLAGKSQQDRKRLLVDDLLVSVANGRVYLWEKQTVRQVIPHLTNMHNFYHRKALPMYRFLSHVARQFQAPFSFDWGPALSDAPYLPRVTHNGVVLDRARWLVDRTSLLHASKTDNSTHVAQLRTALGLPRWVCYGHGDQQIVADLKDPECIKQFLHWARRSQSDRVLIREWLGDPALLPVTADDGAYAHEFLLPITWSDKRTDRPVPAAAASPARHHRTFSSQSVPSFTPGSDWQYWKIYCGEAVADRVLLEVVAPALESLSAGGTVDQWFFVRYHDPGFHLRIRLHGEPIALRSTALPYINALLQEWSGAGLITDVSLATFVPEVERYGGINGWMHTYKLFHLDSVCIINLLCIVARENDQGRYRWLAALQNVHELLSLYGLTFDQRELLCSAATASFEREFGEVTARRLAIGNLYRQERDLLHIIVGGSEALPSPLDHALAPLRQRADRSADSLAELSTAVVLPPNNGFDMPLITSIVHMSLNRLFGSRAREQEAVIWELLRRCYVAHSHRANCCK